ncbi:MULTISPECIES: DUF6325 family protein [unclassified Isoptericola]|uniref:DUF6325 family protein n=1 Tax=unclassified Isoptericola TaxID=2623355 RepID=UPI002713C754|nr:MULTISPECIES: DUF6325 family protein [unclassified Isoptericola]MDO8145090.1 DUF6325 family protein [Isoptericola sp. 178]MDO8148724.1 DUF6325 family protein [Isoptericola sp. b515]MDO8151330.1 DUF6325 family protein [Isoptericola sp. b408]
MTVTAPVELLLVEFPHREFTGAVLAELTRLQDAGTINVLDALAIRRDLEGEIEWFEAADAGSELGDLVGEPAGFLAEDDVDAVAADLAPGTAVGMLVFEHTWATGLAGAVRDAGGRVIDMMTVPAAAIEELTSVLDEED